MLAATRTLFRQRPFRFITQDWSEPSLHFVERQVFPLVIVDHLIATDFANGEILRARVREIESRYSARRPHRKTLRQRGPRRILGTKQIENRPLLGVVR